MFLSTVWMGPHWQRRRGVNGARAAPGHGDHDTTHMATSDRTRGGERHELTVDIEVSRDALGDSRDALENFRDVLGFSRGVDAEGARFRTVVTSTCGRVWGCTRVTPVAGGAVTEATSDV